MNATEFVLLSASTISAGSTVQSLGYDNVRNYLYVGYLTANRISRLSIAPFDRYATGTPSQKYFATSIAVSNNGSAISGSVTDITVETITGTLFISVNNGSSSLIYKINPVTGLVVDLSRTITSSQIHTGFASDQNPYLVDTTSSQVFDMTPLL